MAKKSILAWPKITSPNIERQMRTVKEHVCACFSRMPCKHKPRTVAKHAVSHCVKWLKSFPCKGSCTLSVSPRVLMAGKKLEHTKHCRIETGACAQVHLNRDKTNGMEACTAGSIVLGTNNSIHGSCKFMNVSTGEVLRGHSFAPFPMPVDGIKRVDES